MKTKRAFTLPELLIAASIFSIIILSIYSAFQTGILTYRKVDSAFELYQTVRLLLNRMELDLKNSFAYGDAEGNSRFNGGEHSLDFFSVVDSYKEGEPKTDICRIKYEVNDKVLKRTVCMGLDALRQTPEAPVGSDLSSQVKEISLQYGYKKDGNITWPTSWPDGSTTDETIRTGQKNKLPLAVKIKLLLIEKDKSEENIVEFNKAISLPLGETGATTGDDDGSGV